MLPIYGQVSNFQKLSLMGTSRPQVMPYYQKLYWEKRVLFVNKMRPVALYICQNHHVERDVCLGLDAAFYIILARYVPYQKSNSATNRIYMKIHLNLRWVANRICTRSSNSKFGSGNCQNGTYRNNMEAFVIFWTNFYILMTPNMQN